MMAIKIDIGIDPYNELSNFTANFFKFRGVECGSMEGLLQSLKFPISEKQIKVAGLIGLKAKRKGQKKKWYLDHLLYWQGQPICRFSEEYQALLREAYQALFEQSPEFRRNLKATGSEPLAHTLGKKSEQFTILTELEFVTILGELRDKL